MKNYSEYDLGKDITEEPATMTHQHFRVIAAVIRGMPTSPLLLRAQQAYCASAFADALARTNPRFDRARFLAACTPTEDIDIELDMRQIREEEEREQRYQDFIDALDQGDVYDE